MTAPRSQNRVRLAAPPGPARLSVWGGPSQSETGQATVLATVSMLVVLMMAAFAIDVATMYQKHHQAQVAADAAALGAANCLINGKSANQCTSVTDTTDAAAVATAIARANGVTLTSPTQVSINTASHSVTVISTNTPQVDFAGLVPVNPSIAARSVASFSLPDLPYSIFAGNTSCTANSGIQILSNGGGSANINGLFSDGVIDNNDNSGSANYSGGAYGTGATPQCGSGSAGGANNWQTKNTTIITQAQKAYPVQYVEPAIAASTITSTEPSAAPSVTPGTCTFASSYFSTDGAGIHAIYWPGIYCVTDSSGSNLATTYSGSSCGGTSVDDTTGSTYVGQFSNGHSPSGGFEFAGPCVVANGSLSSSVTPVSSSAPIIYGTAQAASPCLAPTTNLVNPSATLNSPDNIYLSGNDLSLDASIYAPCGTVELSGNTSYAAFIEAANITIDKNSFSSWSGTGPIGAAATDGLSG